jgi:hypothetical protein
MKLEIIVYIKHQEFLFEFGEVGQSQRKKMRIFGTAPENWINVVEGHPGNCFNQSTSDFGSCTVTIDEAGEYTEPRQEYLEEFEEFK